MTIYGSYSNFTTRSGGVLEGLGGGRKGKIGTIYSKVLKIPETHFQTKTVDRVVEASIYLTQMDPSRMEQLTRDLDLGRTIKIRNDIYLKTLKSGKYGVYQNKNNIKQRITNVKAGKLTKEQLKIQTDNIYVHLLQVQQNAKKRN